MSNCRKCGVMNPEGTTRCRFCNVMMPVKMGSRSDSWERSPRSGDLVEFTCPHCGMVNPYTRFKCQRCSLSLTERPEDRSRIWVYLTIGLILLATAAVLARSV